MLEMEDKKSCRMQMNASSANTVTGFASRKLLRLAENCMSKRKAAYVWSTCAFKDENSSINLRDGLVR